MEGAHPDDIDLEEGIPDEKDPDIEEGDEIEEDPDKRDRLDGYYVAMGIILALCILGTLSYMAGKNILTQRQNSHLMRLNAGTWISIQIATCDALSLKSNLSFSDKHIPQGTRNNLDN